MFYNIYPSEMTLCVLVCELVFAQWTVELLLVTTDYVSNNRFPITMVDEVSTGVPALYNNQLVFV